ncbi:MAG: hypothetical protein J6U44_02300 [Paludibacteraceae bacterium]|nr:hypothetical protein [Paludibacteraceae bacterium]
MKTTRFLFAAMLFAALSMGMVSCENNNEPDAPNKNDQTNQGGSNEGGGTDSNGYEWVDLGLSVNWATCNVGATKPEEFGDYFAWGEVEPKGYYKMDNYKWGTYFWEYIDDEEYQEESANLTKYNISSRYGTIDNKVVLDPEDDAATVNMGKGWRMPTIEEFRELVNRCTWTWTQDYKNTGVTGYIVKGYNGNTIFLPAAGESVTDGSEWDDNYDCEDGEFWYHCNYWCSNFEFWGIYALSFMRGDYYDDDYSGNVDVDWFLRYCGLSVRGVCSNKKKELDYSATGVENGHGFVDLGLSVNWATCNVGASSPEKIGHYFSWGEVDVNPKSFYDWSTYKWCNGSYDTMTKYCTDSEYGIVDNKTVLDSEDDAATVNMGGNWRMPTTEEFQELIDRCTLTLTTLNGLKGYSVKGPNGKYIFLPVTGYYSVEGSFLSFIDEVGIYYSSSISLEDNAYADAFCFNSYDNDYHMGMNSRLGGISIRGVCE